MQAAAGYRFAHEAMRTRCELFIRAEARRPSRTRARALAEEAFAELDAVQRSLSAFQPDADLYRLNAAAGTAPGPVSGQLLDFLLRARVLVRATGGAFDPTVGAVVNLLRAARPASARALAAARGCVGFERQVVIDEATGAAGLRTRGARLDPGALGKGYALDRAAALLAEGGARSALLHAGTSSVCALGTEPYLIAIADPRNGAGAPLACVSLAGQSLSVSAVDGQPLRWPGGRHTGHVVDPRTGRPATGARLAAVVADHGTIAEAWSTALLVLGGTGLAAFSRALPGGSALVLGPTPRARPRGCGTAFSLC